MVFGSARARDDNDFIDKNIDKLRDIVMQNRSKIIDGKKDLVRYNFWMYACMATAGTAIALFPYLTWVVMRMRRVRDRYGTKLAIGTMV